MTSNYKQVGHFKDVAAFRSYLSELGISLPMDDRILSAAQGSPLARPGKIGGFTVGNRWCIHPMEGWDGTPDGRPSEHTTRRWRRFGVSGAKLIWGGEALAVTPEGRANPNQLYYRPENKEPIRQLLNTLVDAHQQRFGKTDDLLVGLQLTHSGRFCRPTDKKKLEPRIAYHHPLLDRKFNIDPNDDAAVLTDDQVKRIIDRYVAAAKMAAEAGFKFVDVKHCHGYLGHEFLSAFARPGPYGGSFENRTRFLREICAGIRAACPGLMIGVRLSVFDQPPYHPDPRKASSDKLGPGVVDDYSDSRPYPAFGVNRDSPLFADMAEPVQLLQLMRNELKIELVNLSAGSPYYNPHIQRPAFFPPSDGYQPPEDPLVGCARQIRFVNDLKYRVPQVPIVGTAYTYFQEYLPQVAQAVVRDGWVDYVGIGRMVLAYPDMPADTLETGKLLKAKLICRTFSDCTTAPRNGMISGCFPLDDHYRQSKVHEELKGAKKALKERLKVINQK